MSDDSRSATGVGAITGLLPRTVLLSESRTFDFVSYSGMMPDKDRLWTLGVKSSLTFVLPAGPEPQVLIRFDAVAFVWGEQLPRQTVQVLLGDNPVGNWVLDDRNARRRAILIRRQDLPSSGVVQLTFLTPDCARPADLGINNDFRPLAIGFTRITWDPVLDHARANALLTLYGRRVGLEARKSFDDKLDSGFWFRYITGPNVLDIGFKGSETGIVPIVEGAIGIDLGYPGYDGSTLPFPDGSQDVVFSSHCLEHIPNFLQVIQDWYRVIKMGGHIITIVPNSLLYERKRHPPSRWAGWGHQRFYTPSSLLAEFERALAPNTYRVRHLVENDARYNYEIPPDRHADGCYEIELVIQKIPSPAWTLLD